MVALRVIRCNCGCGIQSVQPPYLIAGVVPHVASIKVLSTFLSFFTFVLFDVCHPVVIDNEGRVRHDTHLAKSSQWPRRLRYCVAIVMAKPAEARPPRLRARCRRSESRRPCPKLLELRFSRRAAPPAFFEHDGAFVRDYGLYAFNATWRARKEFAQDTMLPQAYEPARRLQRHAKPYQAQARQRVQHWWRGRSRWFQDSRATVKVFLVFQATLVVPLASSTVLSPSFTKNYHHHEVCARALVSFPFNVFCF